MMKNQYFGDIGDYGKYSLLRAFAKEGIRVGVNWYLTEDDGTTDGKHISYLEDEHESVYDPILFECLKRMVQTEKRDVEAFEAEGMIPGASYYHESLCISEIKGLKAKREERRRWHLTAMEELTDSMCVFLDPDNGMKNVKMSVSRSAVKYAFTAEAADYYNRGQNIVYYCHKGRRNTSQWDHAKTMLCEHIPDACFTALTFHRGTQRTFIFAIHREDYDQYYHILNRFLESAWGKYFTMEPVNR